MAQGLNAFSQDPEQGQVDLNIQTNTVACVVDSASATLIPGQAVKIVDTGGGSPIITAATVNSDDVFGFVNYSMKDQSFPAGARVEISYFRGNVMFMTASAAISRNAKVMIVVAGSKVVTRSASGISIGRALDKALNNGDLIRVLIDVPGIAS